MFRYLQSRRLNIITIAISFSMASTFSQGANWVAQGPQDARDGQVEGSTITNGQVIGAVNAVAAHPSNADILYIGAANGGIWKSINATQASPNWLNQTDSQASPSIGAVVFDPTDVGNETLVAGIGRYSSFGREGGARSGLLKTINGGANWVAIDGGMATKNISGVAPRGSTILASVNIADTFSCDQMGVFRSTDNGTSFTQLGVAQGVPPGVAYGLVTDRSSSSTLYTAINFGGFCSGDALSDGVYRSTDTGATWSKVSDAAMDVMIGAGFTSNIEIAADGNDVYVNVIVSGQSAGIFHSGNGATSWTAMDLPRTPVGIAASISAPGFVTGGTPVVINTAFTGPHNLSSGTQVQISDIEGTTGANGVWTITAIDDVNFSLDGSSDATPWTADTGNWTKVIGINPRSKPGGQGGIHSSIAIDPSSPGTVYLGGDRQTEPLPNFLGARDFTGNLFRGDTTVAADGSVPSPQWEHLTHSDAVVAIPGGGTASGSAPHADSRQMVFDANGNLIEVDDGGIYRRTSPADNTGDWFSMNGNLQVTEQHDIAYDTVSDIIISGNQDTGTMQQQVSGGLVWDSVSTADGGDVVVDAVSVPSFSTRFSSFQKLQAFRSRVYNTANVLQSQVFPGLVTMGLDEAPIFPFVTRLALNELTPMRLVIAGCNAIYESADHGSTLTQIPGLFETGCLLGWILPGQAAMAYGGVSNSVNNEDILYVGGGDKMYARTGPHPAPLVNLPNYPTLGSIKAIILDPDEWKTVYAVESGIVYKSTDTGVSWTDITGNLAGSRLYSATFIPGSPDLLVVGGANGVFQLDLSSGGPFVWSAIGTGLPTVPVWDLDYDVADDVLVAGTLGRGAWKHSFSLPAGPEFDSNPAANATLAFGDQLINTPSANMQVEVTNQGDVDLIFSSCVINGAGSSHFNLNACPTPVTSLNSVQILINCEPSSEGPKTATLDLATNDADEAAVSFNLTCNGTAVQDPLIFEDGFETGL